MTFFGVGQDQSWIQSMLTRTKAYVIDLSVNTWPRREREAEGSIVVPLADDDVVATLWTFKRTQCLNLRGTEVTDVGLMTLLRLKRLRQLDISGTKVTQEGIRQFQAKRPNCEVINDADWQGKHSPMDMMYWYKRNLGLVDEQGRYIGPPHQ